MPPETAYVGSTKIVEFVRPPPYLETGEKDWSEQGRLLIPSFVVPIVVVESRLCWRRNRLEIRICADTYPCNLSCPSSSTNFDRDYQFFPHFTDIIVLCTFGDHGWLT